MSPQAIEAFLEEAQRPEPGSRRHLHSEQRYGHASFVSAYLVANFKIADRDGYRAYGPAIQPTLAAHGAEVIVADYQTETLEGSPGHATVVLRFESKDAAKAWYESDEYQAAIHYRTDNSEGFVVLCDESRPFS